MPELCLSVKQNTTLMCSAYNKISCLVLHAFVLFRYVALKVANVESITIPTVKGNADLIFILRCSPGGASRCLEGTLASGTCHTDSLFAAFLILGTTRPGSGRIVINYTN